MRRARRTAAAVALAALLIAPACGEPDRLGVEDATEADVPPRAYRPSPRWLRRVPPPVLWADDVPAACVLIETRSAVGNGTIIHSSAEHGTFVLTSERLAVSVASEPPGWARAVDGTKQLVGFPVQPRPGEEEKLRAHRELMDAVQSWREQSPFDDLGALSDEDLLRLAARAAQLGVWYGGSDFAVLELQTRGRLLPAAPIAAVSPADTTPLRVVSILPDRGRLAIKALAVPRGLSVRETDGELKDPQVGSALFDERGRIHGLAARIIPAARDGAQPTEITHPETDQLHERILAGAVALGKLLVSDRPDRGAVEQAVGELGPPLLAAIEMRLRAPHVAVAPAERIRDFLRREGLGFVLGPEPADQGAPPGGR